MSKPLALIAFSIASAFFIPTFGNAPSSHADPSVQGLEKKGNTQIAGPLKPFTGKIIGNHVRMRVSPDLESHIAAELSKDDYVIINGESGDFYSIEAPSDLKAYIFRGFVIDDVIEGDRVNVRLAPDREAPIIGHFSTGQSINGKICETNNKWLEIHVPKESKFYISKEYVEYAGNPSLKGIQENRKKVVTQLLESTKLLTKGEMRKAFPEIDIERITRSYQTIISEYADFPKFVAQASKELSSAQEDYLHRKIAFLEAKASKIKKSSSPEDVYEITARSTEVASPTDRMKVWEPIEEALYLSWSSMHRAKTINDFYSAQKMKSKAISGILEAYKEPVKNKPGDFILKEGDMTVAYLYSTQINLDTYVGKRVNLLVAPRPNNNFAFPAYYVIEVE